MKLQIRLTGRNVLLLTLFSIALPARADTRQEMAKMFKCGEILQAEFDGYGASSPERAFSKSLIMGKTPSGDRYIQATVTRNGQKFLLFGTPEKVHEIPLPRDWNPEKDVFGEFFATLRIEFPGKPAAFLTLNAGHSDDGHDILHAAPFTDEDGARKRDKPVYRVTFDGSASRRDTVAGRRHLQGSTSLQPNHPEDFFQMMFKSYLDPELHKSFAKSEASSAEEQAKYRRLRETFNNAAKKCLALGFEDRKITERLRDAVDGTAPIASVPAVKAENPVE